MYLQVRGSAHHHLRREALSRKTVCGIVEQTPAPVLVESDDWFEPHLLCKFCAKILDEDNSNVIPCDSSTSEYTRLPEIIETSMSAIDTFVRCRRRYMYQEIRGWGPRTVARIMEIGTLFHAGVAAGYEAVRPILNTTSDNDLAILWLEQALIGVREQTTDRDGRALSLEESDRTLVEDMIDYWWHEVGERDLVNIEEIIAVEEPYYMQIGRYRIRCTLDRLVKYRDQDHPTACDAKTGDPQNVSEFIGFDTQTSTYYITIRGNLGGIAGFSHFFQQREVPPGFGHRSLLTDTGLKRKKADLERMQDPKRYVGVVHTEITNRKLDAYTAELIEYIQEIDHCKETGRWTRTKIKTGPFSCEQCPYFNVCKSERDGNIIDDDFASNMFIISGSQEDRDLRTGKTTLKLEDL